MKTIISLLLTGLVLFLIYALVLNIKEPIEFQAVKSTRKAKVVNSLENIRTAQEVFKLATGKYAHNFDTLAQVLKTDSIKIVTIFGDKDDKKSTEEFREVITYRSAIDSFSNLFIRKDMTVPNIDSLRYVPYTNGDTYTIAADTMTYQSTLVNVVEVGTRWKNFMGEYADTKYMKYDNSYDPNNPIKFGDMNAPNLAGNWSMN
jgi:hypothetical protein